MKKIIDYFYGFFMCNTMFLLSNVMLFVLLIGRNHVQLSFFEVYIGCLLLSPAITALYYTMGKFYRYEDISVVRNYIHGYKVNFIQSIKIGVFFFTPILLMLWTRANNTPVFYLQLIACILLILMMLYAYPLLSRYHTDTKSLLILSFISLFRTFKITLASMFFVFICGLILLIYPSLTVLIVFSVVGFMVMFFMNQYLESFETVHQ